MLYVNLYGNQYQQRTGSIKEQKGSSVNDIWCRLLSGALAGREMAGRCSTYEEDWYQHHSHRRIWMVCHREKGGRN